MTTYANFTAARRQIIHNFHNNGTKVHGSRWQGQDVSQRPDAQMFELLFEEVRVQLPTESIVYYQHDIPANYPWVEEHFHERICGVPMNPGKEWENWPWANKAGDSLDKNGQFNHNYMERYWPNHAGYVTEPTKTASEWVEQYLAMCKAGNTGPEADIVASHNKEYLTHRGIKGPVGNMADLVDRLCCEPDTRQAYYPIFFPEDVVVQGRKPCTLGYHFIQRHGHLHVVYYMRSCDFCRHWADDCYLTVRLLLWVLNKCRQVDASKWEDIKPGLFIMHISSLHMFVNDLPILTKEIKGDDE